MGEGNWPLPLQAAVAFTKVFVPKALNAGKRPLSSQQHRVKANNSWQSQWFYCQQLTGKASGKRLLLFATVLLLLPGKHCAFGRRFAMAPSKTHGLACLNAKKKKTETVKASGIQAHVRTRLLIRRWLITPFPERALSTGAGD